VGEINVDYLKCGMVLASDLKDPMGRFLLGKGSRVEEKHIRIMKIWGITAADIEGQDQEIVNREEMKQIEPGLLKKIRGYVNASFCDPEKPDNPDALKEIRRLCVLRTVQRISNGALDASCLDSEDHAKCSYTYFKSPPKENIIPADELVEQCIALSSFPDIYYRIVKVLDDTRSSASHLAEVVSHDPGLSASLLKIINSAFYGLPSRVSSITRAIALIGSSELTTLAMGISVIRYFKDIPPEMIDMKKFWIHSIAAGVFSRILAHRKISLSEEELFIGGLLHDIGRLIIFKAFPHTAAYAIQLSQEKRIPLFCVERELFKYDHTMVAALLLEKWNFPKPLMQMIKHHHLPGGSPRPLDASIINISTLMATALKLGFSGECFVPSFNAQAWDTIDLSTSVLGASITQVDRQVNEILQAFGLDSDQNT
jgi:putative nucleotidyltransferase with HDIG domain